MKTRIAAGVTLSSLMLAFGLLSLLLPSAVARADLQGTDGLVRLSHPETIEQGDWSVGLFGNYYRRMSPNEHSVTENFVVGNLSGRYGLAKSFEVFLALPGDGALWQYKKLPDRKEQNVSHGGLGDARFGLKASVPFESETFALGFSLGASLPTGANKQLWLPGQTVGEKLFTGNSTNVFGRVLASVDLSQVRWVSPLKLVANFGYMLNREKDKVSFPAYLFSIPGTIDNKDVMFGGIGLEFPTPRVTLFTEFYTEQFVSASGVAARMENPIFLTPGAKVRLPFDLTATAAVDILLSSNDPKTPFDPGKVFPSWGFTFGIDFVPALLGSDMDGDGVPDSEDLCPTEPGSRANYGCPESVSPLKPAAQPTKLEQTKPAIVKPAETPVKLEETKPLLPAPAPADTLDSDHDGVPDSKDKCPTLVGPPENYGCPVVDSDGDGVPDVVDKCPDVPGPKSNNGCPK